MALNKQIHIYSMDTNDFYTEEENRINRRIKRYRRYHHIIKYEYCGNKNCRICKKNTNIKNKIKIKRLDILEYDSEKKEKCNTILSKINKKIREAKSELKSEFLKSEDSVRVLDSKKLTDKKVISVFESTLTRILNLDIDELTTDIMIVETYYYEVIEQLIKNGFTYSGEKYRYFTSSAGQIRLKKAVFIKESLWDLYEKSLMCGLTTSEINKKGGINVNKFLAYLALSNSATDLWDDFDIDRCIVVNDFETDVIGKVDYISDVTYEIERREMPVPITHTDGAGMILPRLSKKNFMVRLPWVKGLLASFDFVKFIKENNCSPVIQDIYGKEWNIINDNIQVIFTESQFKMAKYYSSWDEYKEYFKRYDCQAGVCNVEPDYFSKAKINYQMIQTLTDITTDEINKITEKSKHKLYNLSRDKKTMLNAFGVSKSNVNKTYLQQALEIYPELLQDEHCKYVLRQIKKSLIKKYKSAKLEVNASYTFLIPDMYAFCEHLFLNIKNPKGLLNNNEVFCKLFKNYDKVDCLRSPHLMMEHAVRNNVVDKEKSKWFKTNAIYTSVHDLISKILQFDVDGDTSLVVADETIVSIAKRNIDKFNIVPLYYEMKKAHPSELNSDNIWDGLNAAFSGGNIGLYSNDISKIFNSDVFVKGTLEEQSKALNVVKLLCLENNFVIDMAKTLYKPTRPKDIDLKIKKYTKSKLPHFFKYAKDKTDSQVEKNNNSLVNKFENEFKNKPLRFDIKNFGKLNYTSLMNNINIEINKTVIEKYKELNKQYHFKINQKDQENVSYIIKTVKDDLLDLGYSESDVTDMLIKYTYDTAKTPHKEILWNCFGGTIVNNLKNNIPQGSIQCNKCGERFIPSTSNQKLCITCSTYQPIGVKIIQCIDCGKEVEVDAKDNKTSRCKECQHERDKQRKREWKRNNTIKR